jgi:sulfatase maturation enzyme AslB (radical SAM superfamily)
MLMPQDWINFYQSLQKWKKQKLGIIGGEPTVYPGFFDVLNGLDDYYRTITTNLTTPAFNNIAEFVDKIRNHSNLRINTSFHPEITTVDDFANKIHQLRDAGMHVDQISMVAHPGSMYRKYSLEFLRRGIHLAPQTYLGKWNEELLPSPLSDAPDFGEHEIDDRILYEEGFSNRNRHEVLCSSGRFMVAPNGDIHKCHYLLYSGKNPLGNIKDLELPRFNDYDLCGEYGFCNPCDYPHVKFKPVQLELKTELDKLLTDESLSTALWEWFLDHTTPEFQGIIAEVSGILYCSDDPYWTLYNDERLKQVVNDYCEEPGVWDNTRERMFAQMDGSLFRFLPAGVNLYRILNEIPMLKYIDALGHVIRHVLAFHHPCTKRVFEREETAIGLDTLIANIMATVGCSHMNDGSISIWRTCEDGEKEKEEV